MRTVLVRLFKEYAGYKAGQTMPVQEWKYYELKRDGICNLVAGSVSDHWEDIRRATDEEE